jgi:hypothetical protein
MPDQRLGYGFPVQFSEVEVGDAFFWHDKEF